MKIPCYKKEGWEVKQVEAVSYIPDPEWFPFAITCLGNPKYALIWLRREKITVVMVGTDDND